MATEEFSISVRHVVDLLLFGFYYLVSLNLVINWSFYLNLSDPTKQGENVSSFILYKIATRTTRSDFPNNSYLVLRRFSDFTWLHEQLSLQVPGAIIPPLPQKVIVGRFSSEFIEVLFCIVIILEIYIDTLFLSSASKKIIRKVSYQSFKTLWVVLYSCLHYIFDGLFHFNLYIL